MAKGFNLRINESRIVAWITVYMCDGVMLHANVMDGLLEWFETHSDTYVSRYECVCVCLVVVPEILRTVTIIS